MPFRLPIFPLSVVLFPGTPLPLHIFESRYRRMVADCLAADRKFGITPAGAKRELPDPGTVGCVAEIRVHQELPDGSKQSHELGPGEYAINSRGTWHTAHCEGPVVALFITAGKGTSNRPR